MIIWPSQPEVGREAADPDLGGAVPHRPGDPGDEPDDDEVYEVQWDHGGEDDIDMGAW